MTTIIDHLIKLGLSEYEAKAYIATVALGEGTIKAISDESKVPRSRAYEIMERLHEKGFVEAGNAVPRCYRANEPNETLEHLMNGLRQSKEEVEVALNEIGRKAEKRDNPIWTIIGEWAIDRKVCEMMESAKDEVVIIGMEKNHGFLLRYGKQITSSSEKKTLKIVLNEKAEDFYGLLGKASILKMSERMAATPKSIMDQDWKAAIKDAEYGVEMVMVCDHGDSLILSKEGGGHRAIISSGTVVDFFINRMVETAVKEAEVVKEGRTRAPKH